MLTPAPSPVSGTELSPDSSTASCFACIGSDPHPAHVEHMLTCATHVSALSATPPPQKGKEVWKKIKICEPSFLPPSELPACHVVLKEPRKWKGANKLW